MLCLFIPLFPQPPATTGLFTVSTVLLFPDCHVVGIIWCVASPDWLLSFSNMRLVFFAPFLHIVPKNVCILKAKLHYFRKRKNFFRYVCLPQQTRAAFKTSALNHRISELRSTPGDLQSSSLIAQMQKGRSIEGGVPTGFSSSPRQNPEKSSWGRPPPPSTGILCLRHVPCCPEEQSPLGSHKGPLHLLEPDVRPQTLVA